MRKISKIIVTTIVLVAIAGASFSAQSVLHIEYCKNTDEQKISALFDRWNNTLKTGNPELVVNNYAPNSLLLPTLSGRARITAEEKKDYFTHFLKHKPVGEVSLRVIQIGCNSAIDSGNYTFILDGHEKLAARYTFTYKWYEGQWLISSHHSSLVPSQ